MFESTGGVPGTGVWPAPAPAGVPGHARLVDGGVRWLETSGTGRDGREWIPPSASAMPLGAGLERELLAHLRLLLEADPGAVLAAAVEDLTTLPTGLSTDLFDPADLLTGPSDPADLPTDPADLPTDLSDPADLLTGLPAGGVGVGVSDLNDDGVVAVAAAAQRLIGWAVGAQLVAVGELHRRRAARHAYQPDPVLDDEDSTARGIADGLDLADASTAAELALACGISRYAAGQRVEAAQVLPEFLPATWAALRAGDLEWAKAWLICQRTRDLPPAVRARVEAEVLPTAPTHNQPTLTAHLDQAIAAADPLGHAARAKDAQFRRGLAFYPSRRDDGFATMALTGPAPLIAGAQAGLNRILRATLATSQEAGPKTVAGGTVPTDDPSDPRGIGELRADILLDLIDAAADALTHPAHVESADGDDGAEPVSQGDGEDHAGLGDDRHPQAPSPTGPSDLPESSEPSARCEPPEEREPAERRGPSLPTGRSVRLVGRSVRLVGSGRIVRLLRRGPVGMTHVTVTIPLSTALGLADVPAQLAGYGPIPAQMAREAAATGSWRCAITDDRADRPGRTHGALLGLGRATYSPAYVPPAATRAFIHARDARCTFPGCRRCAVGCDLDHRVPWQPGPESGSSGPAATCDCNLQSLCRTHHVLKTHAGFRVTLAPDPQDPPVWTLPSGRCYSSDPPSSLSAHHDSLPADPPF